MSRPRTRYSLAGTGPIVELLPEGPYARGKIDIIHAAVIEPGTIALSVAAEKGASGLIRVQINRNTDFLEHQYSRGWISAIAYTAGNVYIGVMQRAGYGGPVASPLERVEGSGDHEARVLRGFMGAKMAAHLREDVMQIIGRDDAKKLDEMLIEGWPDLTTLARVKYQLRKTLMISEFAKAWRKSLENVAEHWHNAGWPRATEF
jgi:hypothetical protein